MCVFVLNQIVFYTLTDYKWYVGLKLNLIRAGRPQNSLGLIHVGFKIHRSPFIKVDLGDKFLKTVFTWKQKFMRNLNYHTIWMMVFFTMCTQIILQCIIWIAHFKLWSGPSFEYRNSNHPLLCSFAHLHTCTWSKIPSFK